MRYILLMSYFILILALLILVLFTVVRSHNSEKNVHVDSTNSDFTFVAHFWPIGCDRPCSLFETDIINKVILKRS